MRRIRARKINNPNGLLGGIMRIARPVYKRSKWYQRRVLGHPKLGLRKGAKPKCNILPVTAKIYAMCDVDSIDVQLVANHDNSA